MVTVHPSADGTLTVFPVKVERAVRWRFAPEAGPDDDRRWFRPTGGVEPVAELIEPPIVVTKRPVDRPELSWSERV